MRHRVGIRDGGLYGHPGYSLVGVFFTILNLVGVVGKPDCFGRSGGRRDGRGGQVVLHKFRGNEN